MTDTLEVSDFYFHSLRKFRLFPSNTVYTNGKSRNRLATSSQLDVTFAVSHDSQLICFSSSALSSYKVTKENMNSEVTDFPVKKLSFNDVQNINEIGINSSGELLAVLHTNGNTFVSVYSVRTLATTSGPYQSVGKTRIGTDESTYGCALEWNPAFEDTLAATASDNSILVVKFDVKDQSKISVIGAKKFGACGTSISWSPKGKQLTIGDSCGKIVQLKPELDVVRTTMAPEGKGYTRVSGLCWLATTEWLVSFARKTTTGGEEQDAYVLSCKKDKPAEWTLLNELSYSSAKSSLSALLLSSAELLVNWNVVLTANSKTSQVTALAKRDAWQTWIIDEGKDINLPTKEDRSETFAVGVTVNRSATDDVLLTADGSKRHAPSPIVMVLTTDGVMTAHHVVSSVAAHPSCQIKGEKLTVVGAAAQNVGQSAPQAAPLVQTKTPSNSLFGGMAMKSDTSSTSTTANVQAVAPSIAKTPLSKTQSVAQSTPNIPEKTTTTTTSTSQTPTTEPKAMMQKSAEKVEAQKNELVEEKKRLIAMVEKVSTSISEATTELGKLTVGTQNVAVFVAECRDVVSASAEDSKEIISQLHGLLEPIEAELERAKHQIQEMDLEVRMKTSMATESEDGDELMDSLRDMANVDKIVRFNKVEAAVDSLNEKFGDCINVLETVRAAHSMLKENNAKRGTFSPLRFQKMDLTSSSSEKEIALKVMRNISKIILDTRERIERNEILANGVKREMERAEANSSKLNNTMRNESIRMINLPKNKVTTATSSDETLKVEDAGKARIALLQILRSRGKVTTKPVKLTTYQPPENRVPPKVDTSNLTSALLKMSMTPRRVMTASASPETHPSARRDATTQADEPPVVQKVVVTVESRSPSQPTTTQAPVTSIASMFGKATTTSSMATPTTSVAGALSKTSSLFGEASLGTTTTKKVEEKTAASKSIFGGSSPFLAKTDNEPAPATKSSLFGGFVTKPNAESESVKEKKNEGSPNVEKENKNDDLKVEKRETEPIPVVEKETPVEEKKEVTPEPEKIVPKEETKAATEESQTKTAVVVKSEPEPESAKPVAFSFAPAVPVSNAATPSKPSSMFGGGIQQQHQTGETKPVESTTSSLFGGGVANPAAAVSSFGAFGQKPAETTTPQQPAAVSFSFNTGKPAAAATPAASPFGSFGQAATSKPAPSGFAAAAAAVAADDGMDEDMGGGGASGGLFGGGKGFLSGLGGSSSSTNTTSNIFAAKNTAPASSSPASTSWLFGGASQQQQNKPASFSFASAAAQQAQNNPQQPQQTSSVFGGNAKFGANPMFGSKPAFGGGAAPGGGSLSKNASIFGGAAAPAQTATGGFAQFASGGGSGSSVFGGGASTTMGTSSIFGGGAAKPTGTPSIFGGGTTQKPNSNFSSWR